MKYSTIILVLLLIINTISAVEITPIDSQTEEISEEVVTISKLNILESKINDRITKAEAQALAEQIVLTETTYIDTIKRDMLVFLIVINITTIGIAYALLLNLKAKRLI